MWKRCRFRVRFLLFLFLALAILGCGGGGGDAVAASDAARAAQAVAGGLSLIFGYNGSWSHAGSSLSWAEGRLSMSGSKTSGGSTVTYALTTTFSGYPDSDYLISGTLTCSFSVNVSTGAVDGTITGNLALDGGPVSSQTWNVSITDAGPDFPPSFSGAVTCNGSSFGAGTLALADRFRPRALVDSAITDASKALRAVFSSVNSVLGSQASWSTGAGDSVSYSSSGVAMTGTRVVGATTSYDLTLTFSSYLDSTSGYTLSGSIQLVESCDMFTIFSASLSGTVTLSGAPVSSMTTNLTSGAGTSDGSGRILSLTLSGTVVADGATVPAPYLAPF